VSEQLKSCCASLYETDLARLLLGDSFHPGGMRLTRRLGEKLGLLPGQRVLDVASGKGESAIFLARTFGCEVVGIDFGANNVEEAGHRLEGHADALVSFEAGDAENLAFPDASFDAVICECAFCTFPDKRAAAGEFARVLKPGGKAGISDLTRNAMLPPELDGLLAWISCIADARPVEDYARYLTGAGMRDIEMEAHDEALAEMVRDIQGKLLGAELMSKIRKFEPDGIDFAQARGFANAAAAAVRSGSLGYALVVGVR
jgi:arsenite methyltransferase